MTFKERLAAIFLLALLGFTDAAWLTAQSLVSALGAVCGPVGDCQQILTSTYAHLFGIPLPVFGLMMYATLLIIGYVASSVPGSKKPVLFLRGVASLGVLLSAVLMYIQFFVLHAFCLFCTLSAVVVTSIWLLSIFLLRELSRGEASLPARRRFTLYGVSLFVVLLYVGFIFVVATARTSSSGIVAQIGNEVITEKELNDGILASIEDSQRQLQEAKLQWLDQALSDRLLRKEAERRKTSVMSLEDEVIGRVPAVSDSEVVILAKAWKLEVNKLTEEERQYLRSLLISGRKNNPLKKFVDSLKETYGVKIFLQKPLIAHAEFDLTGSPRSGRDDAPVTLVVFTDFECHHCATMAKELQELQNNYKDSLRIVIKNFPQETHPDAFLAAEAALCANEQGQFWKYHDLLFANQGRLGREMLTSYAEQAGIDVARFTESLESRKNQQLVARDRSEAGVSGVSGTPALFVNGRPLVGELSLDRLQREVSAAMEVH